MSTPHDIMETVDYILAGQRPEHEAEKTTRFQILEGGGVVVRTWIRQPSSPLPDRLPLDPATSLLWRAHSNVLTRSGLGRAVSSRAWKWTEILRLGTTVNPPCPLLLRSMTVCGHPRRSRCGIDAKEKRPPRDRSDLTRQKVLATSAAAPRWNTVSTKRHGCRSQSQ